MPYHVKWLVEGRVLYIKPVGDISVEELENSVGLIQAFMDNGEAPIHSISDNRFVGKFPTSLSSLRKLMSPHPKGTGWTLMIQENASTRFIGEMLTRFSGQNKVKSFVTLGEGLAFLERSDAGLGKIESPES